MRNNYTDSIFNSSVLICLALCFLSIRTHGQAKWNCGVAGAANVVAAFDGDKQTLVISGKGKMGDGSPWANLSEAIKVVKINPGVTTIGKSAFIGLKNLETVVIANTVTSIGERAFQHTKSLRKIDIPSGVTYIGIGAFANSGLESITLPRSVTEIDMSAFKDCASLKTADLSKTQILNIHFFNGCELLEEVFLPEKLEEIRSYGFSRCKSLKSITCYNSTPPKIESDVFYEVGDLSGIKLYVPKASIVVYKYSNVWKEFGSIEAVPEN